LLNTMPMFFCFSSLVATKFSYLFATNVTMMRGVGGVSFCTLNISY
jgi:hypothetical protein